MLQPYSYSSASGSNPLQDLSLQNILDVTETTVDNNTSELVRIDILENSFGVPQCQILCLD